MTTAVILGCAVRSDNAPSATLDLRIRHAAHLHRTGRVIRICATGGAGRHGPAEAHVARNRLIELGVPATDIVIEDTSRTTFENLINSLPMIGTGPVILVSSRWHLPRARLMALIIGLDATSSGPPGTARYHVTLAAILREIAATPVSAVRAVRWARRNGR